MRQRGCCRKRQLYENRGTWTNCAQLYVVIIHVGTIVCVTHVYKKFRSKLILCYQYTYLYLIFNKSMSIGGLGCNNLVAALAVVAVRRSGVDGAV
jgi:hypothetical protein